MNPLIDMDHLVKIYRGGKNEVRALDGISLRVNRGEFVAIVGPSGSGKSALMNLLGCLDAPSAGEYRLDGENVSKMTDEHRSLLRNLQIGFIFQGFHLISTMTALENVELPLIYRGLPREERRDLCLGALRRVGLENRLDQKPTELPGGEQQRVAIARAIAARPPLLLADEPTGALDAQAGEEIMRLLHALHREGKTILLLTQDQKIAAEAERLVRLRGGVIVEDRPVTLSAANRGQRQFAAL